MMLIQIRPVRDNIYVCLFGEVGEGTIQFHVIEIHIERAVDAEGSSISTVAGQK